MKFIVKGMLLLAFLCLSQLAKAIDFKTTKTQISINSKGFYTSIQVDGKEILSDGAYPILSVVKQQQLILPISMTRNKDLLRIQLKDGQKVVLRVQESIHAIVYEVVEIPEAYEMLMFGPVKVKLHEVVGEVVGVSQGNGLAFGIQAMNIKTVAGIPQEAVNLYHSQFAYEGQNTELSVASVPYYHFAAVDTEDGTVFQLSCKNRTKEEYRKVQQLTRSLTLPVAGEDGSIRGAKVALFGDLQSSILERIGQIELKEGLPHPMLEEEWAKISRKSMRSYLITNFSESDLDLILDKAERAGFRNIYHAGPFKTWGHFQWDERFVKDGDEGVKRIVEKAKNKGVQVGVHTLTNFLTTNDPYVTPVPSKQLLKQGKLKLRTDIDAEQTTILIEKSDLFEMPLSLNALHIDDELIQFGAYEAEGEYMKLTNCTRGAFGTKVNRHSKEAVLYKLWDYPYKTLFPDLDLQNQFASRLAEIFNRTGLKQISFDGLEGSTYTGQDYYATARFVTGFYNNLQDKDNLINDASRLEHFLWHVHTRMNWGEPWGEEMRKGQVANRIKNQDYFRRNLFPRMLGWFLIRLADRKFEATSLEDLEWALSESAGFDAGYAMNIDLRTLRNHGQIDLLLDAIKNWDELRSAKAFSPTQMEKLKDPATEWQLKKIDAGSYQLYPLFISERFRCDFSEMQPGQPGGADWVWHSPYVGNLGLRLRVEGEGSITNPAFITPTGAVKFLCTVEAGQYLLLDHEGKATVTDKNYKVLKEIAVEGKAQLPKGAATVAFSCDVEASTAPEVTVRYTTRGEPELIRK